MQFLKKKRKKRRERKTESRAGTSSLNSLLQPNCKKHDVSIEAVPISSLNDELQTNMSFFFGHTQSSEKWGCTNKCRLLAGEKGSIHLKNRSSTIKPQCVHPVSDTRIDFPSTGIVSVNMCPSGRLKGLKQISPEAESV